ncbi:peptide chain release factor N(5)-glutamine methyltransferase [Kingella kingae]|uniref:peptide chain release factor N(5)-glutamine methyltransferase n=1 Tax=Kingella kingae TaxID=504 RepID=UPI000571B27E|nr:peptide chain release factor N(5)-glutamine methyltransferase [Kingella kingae]MDK4618618.1 peptide chain release factor N(5)-glutamine methyltransferase [Kingella kingae]MDK4666229.1 peptide chain release factor N(5)-glutamine methyltransferase [Kingella kingae]
MTTIAQFIANSPLPRNETRMLLQYITGLSRSQLITHDSETLSPEHESSLHALCQRREQGEPIAYLLGEREFYGRSFTVSPAVLIPRPETEHLLEAALCRLPARGFLWDMGTGSGIIAISAKLERTDANVFASDISPDALNIAQHNAQRLGAAVAFAQGSWFDCAVSVHKFDVIASNPPYINSHDTHLQQGDLRFEPAHALTDFADGLAHIRHIVAHAPDYLQPQGWLLLEHGYDQGAAIRDLFAQHGYTQVETLRDLAGLERVTLGQMG